MKTRLLLFFLLNLFFLQNGHAALKDVHNALHQKGNTGSGIYKNLNNSDCSFSTGIYTDEEITADLDVDDDDDVSFAARKKISFEYTSLSKNKFSDFLIIGTSLKRRPDLHSPLFSSTRFISLRVFRI